MAHCLVFEAASIHEYLMASGRLRHIVGASETIEALCGPTLDRTLASLGVDGDVVFSRRAGGVFVAHAEAPEPLQRLAQAWSLVVREQLPGLSFKLALGEGGGWRTAAEQARRRAEGTRSASVRELPLSTPFSRRHRATGGAAVGVRAGEPLDAASVAKARAADNDQRRSGLGGRFLAGSQWRDWPLDLSADEGSEQAFPFLDDEQALALVVADGNGLGQLLRDVHRVADQAEGAAYAGVLREFSEGLEAATQAAARQAVEKIVVPMRAEGSPLPMRPVLLGGDDVVAILRADLALGFAQAFAQAFEAQTALRLGGFASASGGLTASVGIVYFGRRQPIAQVQGLVYEVMKGVAKKHVKRALADGQPVPAAIAWHRLTVSEIANLDDLQRHDWACTTAWGRVQVAGLPYLAGAGILPGVGSLPALRALREEIARQPAASNHLREILGLLASDAAAALFRYRRWREVQPETAARIQTLCADVYGGLLQSHPDLPLLFQNKDKGWISPIGDVLAVMAAESVASTRSTP